MKKIILYAALTIDGYIARENGDVDFLIMNEQEDYGYREFAQSIDTVVMGYKTYEKSLTFPGNPFADGKTYYVCSRKNTFPQDDRVIFTNSDLKTLTDNLRLDSGDGHIWMMGGGDLLQSFYLNGISIDEIMIFVVPLILGNGLPLFKSQLPEIQMTLVESKSYRDGLVKLHYRTTKNAVEFKKS